MRDSVTIGVRAGRGGDGAVSFRREKYVPRGGPDGGDGGRGGNVVLVSTEKTPSLDQIRNNSVYRAELGAAGGRSRKSGAQGEDLLINVPPGTSVFDAETGEPLGELPDPGERLVVAAGGAGGRGNCHFATPKNRAPLQWEPGLEGGERELKLVFSVPAEAGVVGLPGSGKSSLVAAVSNSKTKIGDYEFTTLQPQLGTCSVDPTSRFRILDMPALVEGSSEGRGVGNAFLRHLHRVKLVVYLIDGARLREIPAAEQFEILRNEVAAYDTEYAKKDLLIVINKIDAAGAECGDEAGEGLPGPVLKVSAKEKTGMEKFIETVAGKLGLAGQ